MRSDVCHTSLLSDLLGVSFLKLLKGKDAKDVGIFKRPHPTPKWLRPVYYLIVAAALTYTGMWPVFLL